LNRVCSILSQILQLIPYGPDILRATLIGLMGRVTDCRSTKQYREGADCMLLGRGVTCSVDRTGAIVPLRYGRSRVQEIQAAPR
jgi:hypothetical protein